MRRAAGGGKGDCHCAGKTGCKEQSGERDDQQASEHSDETCDHDSGVKPAQSEVKP